ncbi:MAG TPA: sugar phosphate isomerase/epimerase family protein [Gemmataceae bacterium]|nr:sugar phosphate isomerase/epimerase family protein [Gemmataceae bacterium]
MQYAICNETFEGWEHARVCKTVAELGYTGLEVAPFTLAPRITDVTAAQRKKLRGEAESAGLRIIGLHWLLAKTEGFHLTAPDASVRQRTADYLVELAKACRDLGGDLMVFGSPIQRKVLAGVTPEQATDYAVDCFNRAKNGIADAGVKLCLEPLAPREIPLAPGEADFMQTAAEGCAILDRIKHPNFILHLDVKAMSSESIPIPELIHTHIGRLGHFHANDPNKRGPGFGKVDFVPIFRALKDAKYTGWVSVEVFDYTPDPVTIARESIRYMRECEAKV